MGDNGRDMHKQMFTSIHFKCESITSDLHMKFKVTALYWQSQLYDHVVLKNGLQTFILYCHCRRVHSHSLRMTE